jgi:hypothetical protein
MNSTPFWCLSNRNCPSLAFAWLPLPVFDCLHFGKFIVLLSQRNDIVVSFRLLSTVFEALSFILLQRFSIETHEVCFS